jgi:MFS family permease
MYTLMVALIIFGISGSLMGTSFAALSTDLVPRELRGRIMGVMGTLNIIATIPAYVIGGILYEIGPSLPFYLLILETIIVLIIIILFIREPKVRFE